MIPPRPPPSSVTTSAVSEHHPPSRGAFIVLEGVDRCGKTTQASVLLKRLISLGISAAAMRFPDRTTPVGTLINSYLTSQNTNLDDRAIHLLFSANRWEAAPTLKQYLAAGTTVVCDRYCHSGVAFSSAKLPTQQEDSLTVEWCKGPDIGLPAPDAVIFLQLSQEESEKRGGFGQERYEKRDLQMRVRQRFQELQDSDDKTVPWHVIDAAQSIDQVTADIAIVVDQVLEQVVQHHKPLYKMWTQGTYNLTTEDPIEP